MAKFVSQLVHVCQSYRKRLGICIHIFTVTIISSSIIIYYTIWGYFDTIKHICLGEKNVGIASVCFTSATQYLCNCFVTKNLHKTKQRCSVLCQMFTLSH